MLKWVISISLIIIFFSSSCNASFVVYVFDTVFLILFNLIVIISLFIDITLPTKSIFNVDNYNNAEPNVEHAYKNSELLTIPNGMKRYIKMFKAINEN